jgi:hypothetical protein
MTKDNFLKLSKLTVTFILIIFSAKMCFKATEFY